MYRRRYYKRRTFLPFVIFRTLLSLVIFGILIIGGYNALKQFSGFDIVKFDFQKALPVGRQDLPKIAGTFVDSQPNSAGQNTRSQNKAPVSFKFILVADSHNDNQNLKKALSISDVQFVIGLGDYTEVGTLEELKNAKKAFDEAGLRYFLTAGDHDLWDSRNQNKDPVSNFSHVFGSPYQSFSYKQTRFVIVYNSDNYLGVADSQIGWLKEELARIKKEADVKLILTFMHEPLYHPSSVRGMGKVTPKLLDQAKDITKILKDAGVKGVFAGDIHYFTKYSEPETGMAMITVGALVSERNAQNPRYAVVTIYEDGGYDVEDVEVK